MIAPVDTHTTPAIARHRFAYLSDCAQQLPGSSGGPPSHVGWDKSCCATLLQWQDLLVLAVEYVGWLPVYVSAGGVGHA